VTREQRLFREHDPRVRRSLGAFLAWAGILVAMALAVVGLRVQQVRLAYELDRLRADHARAEGLIGQLEVEVATLRSPARLEALARQIGLTTPARDQVRQAREFVAGSSGLAASSAARVEAQAALGPPALAP
jgi:cell division protein FtsL